MRAGGAGGILPRVTRAEQPPAGEEGPISSPRFQAFLTAAQLIASVLFLVFLLDQGQTFLATVVVLAYMTAVWRAWRRVELRVEGWDGTSKAEIFVVWAGMAAAFVVAGLLVGAPGFGIGANPPMLIPLYMALFLLYEGFYPFIMRRTSG
ncbi:MAG: hypothetical protein ABEK12_00280, partial [Candidatus Nanohaloarchaea archaeon]